jgi:hypothetical protein
MLQCHVEEGGNEGGQLQKDALSGFRVRRVSMPHFSEL